MDVDSFWFPLRNYVCLISLIQENIKKAESSYFANKSQIEG